MMMIRVSLYTVSEDLPVTSTVGTTNCSGHQLLCQENADYVKSIPVVKYQQHHVCTPDVMDW